MLVTIISYGGRWYWSIVFVAGSSHWWVTNGCQLWLSLMVAIGGC